MLFKYTYDILHQIQSLKVFEDETEAAKYCDLLQGGGQGCEGVAEVEASSVRTLSLPLLSL